MGSALLWWHSDFRLPEVITEPGRTTTYTYSPYDNPNYTQKMVADTATGETRIWGYDYNSQGQMLSVDGPRGDVTDTLSYTYYNCTTGGQCGHLETLTNGLGQTTTYNSYNAHGGSSAYTYDSNGNQIQHTDASNRVSSTEYDALDRVIKDIDAIAGETAYTYDDRDNLTTVTDPEGLTTTYTYNGFDEVVSEQSPDTGTTSYTYDSAGNRATQTDARGITTTYSYDALNRLTQISYPDSSENITYVYDQGTNGVGRLTQITDASGTTDYGYDARGNCCISQ